MERGADHDGIMVWSGIPNWQNISFGKPEVYAKGVGMLKEMIRRDRNKASVILRSVFNETPNNPTRTKSLTGLAGEARRLDPTLQDGYNRKGLIAEDGTRKQSFYLFRKAYAEHSVGKAQ
jgi:hypothetical protein